MLIQTVDFSVLFILEPVRDDSSNMSKSLVSILDLWGSGNGHSPISQGFEIVNHEDIPAVYFPGRPWRSFRLMAAIICHFRVTFIAALTNIAPGRGVGGSFF